MDLCLVTQVHIRFIVFESDRLQTQIRERHSCHCVLGVGHWQGKQICHLHRHHIKRKDLVVRLQDYHRPLKTEERVLHNLVHDHIEVEDIFWSHSELGSVLIHDDAHQDCLNDVFAVSHVSLRNNQEWIAVHGYQRLVDQSVALKLMNVRNWHFVVVKLQDRDAVILHYCD